MSQIFLLAEDGRYEARDLDLVRGQVESGGLPREALYWREGMEDWRPLGELFPASPPPVRSASPSGGSRSRNASRYFLRRRLEPWTTILLIFIAGCAALSGYTLFLVLGDMAVIARPDAAPEMIHALILQIECLVLAYAAWWLVTSVFFVVWTYRVNKNARGFSPGLRHRSAMAAWSYFIPFLNLIYPCLILQEVWKVSRDPRNWHDRRGSVLVGLWWAAWLVMCVLDRSLAALLSPYTHDGLVRTFRSLACLEISKLVLDGLAFAMIVRITSLQKRLTR